MDMKTIFRAVGPSFKAGLEVEPFESVHVYELMCRLLGIVPEANDGDPATLLPMLHTGEGRVPQIAACSGGHRCAHVGACMPVTRIRLELRVGLPPLALGNTRILHIPTTRDLSGAPHASQAAQEGEREEWAALLKKGTEVAFKARVAQAGLLCRAHLLAAGSPLPTAHHGNPEGLLSGIFLYQPPTHTHPSPPEPDPSWGQRSPGN